MNSKSDQVGILHLGDLGSGMAVLMQQNPMLKLFTCTAGRSDATRARASSLAITDVESLEELLDKCGTVLSLVPPDVAPQIAQQCAKFKRASDQECLFIDMNSIGIPALHAVQETVLSAGFRFANATVHGNAQHLGTMGVIYTSGEHAADIGRLYTGLIRIDNLGPQTEQATYMKLLMGGQSKSLCVLFLELANVAAKLGMLESFLAEQRAFYPAIFEAITRMLPTYPDHAQRRVHELRGISQLCRDSGHDERLFNVLAERLQTASEAWSRTSPSATTVKAVILSSTPNESGTNRKD